ncbi:MAG: hypothetical protein KF684_06320 [Phycisphaeraceae bacterium]|nr:hypothetical protein [Phycisphaeraceae bacterium]
MKRILPLLVFATTMPGCVVWEIRDEMRNVHAQLNEVNAELEGVNTSLESVQIQLAMLEQTRDRLIQVEGGLGQTNDSLSSLDQQLQLLRSIQTSLGNLDAHLLSLRKSIQGINRVVPFLNFGGDDIVQSDAPVAAVGSGGPASASGAPVDDEDADAPALVRPDPLLGVWMTVRPAGGPTLIVDRDSYLLEEHAADGQVVLRSGAWSRDGNTLVLQPEGVDEMGAPLPERRWEIVLQTGRSMAIRRDRDLLIFAKP